MITGFTRFPASGSLTTISTVFSPRYGCLPVNRINPAVFAGLDPNGTDAAKQRERVLANDLSWSSQS